jgi:hypothetical protein
VTLVFWSAIATATAFRLKPHRRFLLGAAALIGLGVATKLSLPLLLLLPILISHLGWRYGGWKRLSMAGALTLATLLAFLLANRSGSDPALLKSIYNNALRDNIFVQDHSRWLNPFFFVLFLIPGVGLPSFVAAAGAVARIRWATLTFQERVLVVTAGPLLAAHLAMISALSVPFIRHALPLVPAICVAAGVGLSRFLRDRRPRRAVAFMVAAVFGYQLLTVFSIERAYVGRQHINALGWILGRWQPGQRIFVRRPPRPFKDEDCTSSINAATFAFIDDTYPTYRLILERSQFNPLHPPSCNERLYHTSRTECESFRRLRAGTTALTDVKIFRAGQPITPETWLYKRIWGSYLPGSGDVLVYARPRTRSDDVSY